MLDEIISAIKRRESHQTKMNTDTRPAFKKYSMLRKIDKPYYKDLTNKFLTPTSICFDETLFDVFIEKYKNSFSTWKNLETNQARYGEYALPLVNSTATINNGHDTSLRYLEDVNTIIQDRITLENDFLLPTETLSHECFNCINDIKLYMLRSYVSRWTKGAIQLPRFDMIFPTTFLQLWAVNKPTNLILSYEDNYDLVEVNNIEPFRLYIFDASTIYTKHCVQDEIYQISITTSIDAYKVIKEMCI